MNSPQVMRFITNEILDLVQTNKGLVSIDLDEGRIPLVLWCHSLNCIARDSLTECWFRMHNMHIQFRQGKHETLAGSLFIHKKRTFTEFKDFFDIIYGQAKALVPCQLLIDG